MADTTEPKLLRALNTWDLAVYGMMYMIPVAPFAWYGSFLATSNGMIALAYAIGFVAMLFTGFSYGAMSHRFPIAGSVYSYVQRGTRAELGFLAGWAICLDYILVPAVCYLLGAIFMQQLIPSVPQWVWIVIFVVITTVINVLGVRLLAIVNWLLFGFQIAVILYFLIAVWIKMGQGTIHWNTLSFYNPHGFKIHAVLATTVIVVVSYLGFDAVSTLAEEAHEPKRQIPRGLIFSILGAGSIFVIISYFAGVAAPDFGKLSADTAVLDIAKNVGGVALKDLMIIVIAVSFGFACGVEALAAISRIMYAMGRDGILPKVLATIHPKWHTPWIAILFVTVLSFVVAESVSLGLLASLLSFGALIGFMALNLSVVWHFFIKGTSARNALNFVKYVISPLIGFGVCVWIWANMGTAAYTVGGCWLGAGIVYLLYRTRVFTKPSPVLALDDVLAPEEPGAPALGGAGAVEEAAPST
jgi:amino acid transporter